MSKHHSTAETTPEGTQAQELDKMPNSSCGHKVQFLILPPTIEYLQTEFPAITPNRTIDRTVPRCKFCDLLTAHERAIEAELPGPTYANPITKIEEQIRLAKELIQEGVRKEELERALPLMKKKLAETAKAIDERIKEAWIECWGIWGLEKSQ